MLACNDPSAYAMTRMQEARMEAQAQRRQRRALALAVAAAVQALVAFEAKDGHEVEQLLLEAERYQTAQTQTA